MYSSIFAMNTMRRGHATASTGMSHMLRWFAATITGPPGGTCSAPVIRMWNHHRMAGPATFRANPTLRPIPSGKPTGGPDLRSTAAATSASVRNSRTSLSTSRIRNRSSTASARSAHPSESSPRSARGTSSERGRTPAPTSSASSSTARSTSVARSASIDAEL